MAAVQDPHTGPPKSLLLMISRSLPTIKFMTSYEKRFKCAHSTHSKRPRRAPACGPKERPQPFAPLHCTHCSTKDPFSRRFTKHDYFNAHRIILYISFQIEKPININKHVSKYKFKSRKIAILCIMWALKIDWEKYKPINGEEPKDRKFWSKQFYYR